MSEKNRQINPSPPLPSFDCHYTGVKVDEDGGLFRGRLILETQIPGVIRFSYYKKLQEG